MANLPTFKTLSPSSSSGIAFVARLTLAAVFVYAGFTKAGNVAAFSSEIEAYGLTGSQTSLLLAATLPWAEIAAGIACILPWTARAGLWALAILLAVFSGVLGYAWAEGLGINCGCFGNGDSTVQTALVRDGILALVLLTAFWFGRREARQRSPK